MSRVRTPVASPRITSEPPPTPALLFLSLLFSAMVVAASELQRFNGVRLIPTEWADGDSFQVRFPDGSAHTVRLFGVDCFEWHITDDTDAKRLRDQRRHFGIFSYGGGPATSVALAKSLGEAAGKEVRTLLQRPFTLERVVGPCLG